MIPTLYHLEIDPLYLTSLTIRVEGKVDIEALKKEEWSGSHVRVKRERSLEIIKLLALTGRFYFKGKKLIVDLFSKPTLYYEVGEEVSAHLKVSSTTFPLISCDLIIFPCCFVKDGFLRKLPEIDWTLFQKVYPKPSFLDEKILKRLKEESEHEVIWKRQKITPLPFLKLKDRTGVFADLWFDYAGEKVAFHEEKSSFHREWEEERAWERDLLETDFKVKKMEGASYYCSSEKVGKSLRFLTEIGWKIFDYRGKELKRLDHQSLSSDLEEWAVKVRGKVKFQNEEATIGQALHEYRKGKLFLDLSEHAVGLLDVPQEWKWGDLEEMEIVGDHLQTAHHRATLLEPLEITRGEALSLFMEGLEKRAIEKKDIPGKDFIGTLYPYQKKGVEWLYFLYQHHLHALLADEMGLGKTVQVLAFLSLLEKGPHLIVAPKSLLFQWEKEIARFLPAKREEITLMSYSQLREAGSEIFYHSVILDEASTIKNPDSLVARSSFRLNARFRISMTGTPYENSFEDIWSQFHFLIPGLLNERKELNETALLKMKKRINPFILRRRKEEVIEDLPPKFEQDIWVEQCGAQKELYDAYLKRAGTELLQKVTLSGIQKHRMEIFEILLRLRQICCHPQLIDPEVRDSAKLSRLLQDLEEAILEKRKVLIYSQFSQMLKLIEKEVKSRGWPYVYMDGDTQDRQSKVEEFQNNDETLLFLLTLKVGGVGLNLTAADEVFIYDPWWNEAVENQAIDRAHRLGRKGSVIARRYLTASTIEEKMMALKKKKAYSSAQFLNIEESIYEITLEDLHELFN